MVALLIYHLYALHAATTTFGLPGATALRALRDGLLSGWARMLTVALPADPTGDLLGTPTTMAFLAGVGSALLVLRTRAVISLAIAPLAVLVIGLVFTASVPGHGIWVTVAVLLVTFVVLLIRTNRLAAANNGIAEAAAGAVGLDLAARRRHSTIGRVLVGLPAVAGRPCPRGRRRALLPIADGRSVPTPGRCITRTSS